MSERLADAHTLLVEEHRVLVERRGKWPTEWTAADDLMLMRLRSAIADVESVILLADPPSEPHIPEQCPCCVEAGIDEALGLTSGERP